MDFNAIRSRLFGFGRDVLNVAFDEVTGTMLAQTGDSITGTTESNNVEIWQPWGLVSNPGAAAAGSSAAQGLVVRGGSRDILIAGRDLRAANSFGNCPPGRTILFSSTSSARVVAGEDGSVTLFTTDSGQQGGNGIFLRLATDGLTFVAPWGQLTFDGSGFHVTTDGGPTLDLGTIGGLPGPLASLASYFTVSGAGICQLDCAQIMLGPKLSPTGYQPVGYYFAANPLTPPGCPLLSGTPLTLPAVLTGGTSSCVSVAC